MGGGCFIKVAKTYASLLTHCVSLKVLGNEVYSLYSTVVYLLTTVTFVSSELTDLSVAPFHSEDKGNH